jgi:hypothetical protein
VGAPVPLFSILQRISNGERAVNNLNSWDYAMLGVGALGIYFGVKHSGVSKWLGFGLAAYAAYYVYTDYSAT